MTEQSGTRRAKQRERARVSNAQRRSNINCLSDVTSTFGLWTQQTPRPSPALSMIHSQEYGRCENSHTHFGEYGTHAAPFASQNTQASIRSTPMTSVIPSTFRHHYCHQRANTIPHPVPLSGHRARTRSMPQSIETTSVSRYQSIESSNYVTVDFRLLVVDLHRRRQRCLPHQSTSPSTHQPPLMPSV